MRTNASNVQMNKQLQFVADFTEATALELLNDSVYVGGGSLVYVRHCAPSVVRSSANVLRLQVSVQATFSAHLCDSRLSKLLRSSREPQGTDRMRPCLLYCSLLPLLPLALPGWAERFCIRAGLAATGEPT